MNRRLVIRTCRWAVVVLLTLAWIVTLRPQSLGGPAGYVTVSGQSMEPTMHTGDLVLVRALPRYEPGDTIAYRVPADQAGAGSLVIHRVVNVNADGSYETQGDNNARADTWTISQRDVIGKHWVLVPKAGALSGWLRSPLPLAVLAGGLSAWVFLGINSPRRSPVLPSPAAARPPQPLPARRAAVVAASVAAGVVDGGRSIRRLSKTD